MEHLHYNFSQVLEDFRISLVSVVLRWGGGGEDLTSHPIRHHLQNPLRHHHHLHLGNDKTNL
jgi:hypothetical protein